ncbi:MAG TPA: ATP-dependent 6-phosphofructokinase [Alphaproteobacteria bacterium]|nr:ATP-dependent 6-phosphofructokinase [Alphaproteobacteria bacterium]
MAQAKRIGILTSGGDCAGLNAVIRAVVFRAVHGYGWEVLGIKRGTMGLLRSPPDVVPLTLEMFHGEALRMGGTLIGTTNRGNPFNFLMKDGSRADRSDEIYAGYRELGLDAMIVVGGDGSFQIVQRLAKEGGLNVVCIPKTIDNDVPGTENAVGYITAVNVATEALDRLQTTAASHSRIMILEVMGRDAGHIALAAGVAGGADIILVPEVPFTIDALARKIKEIESEWDRDFALVVAAEGCASEDGKRFMIADQHGQARYGGIGHYLAEQLARTTGWETRFTILGHVQRGGQPSTTDRVVGAAYGVHAVDLVNAGSFDRVVVWQNRQVTDLPLSEVAGIQRCVEIDGPVMRTARGLGISFGDG